MRDDDWNERSRGETRAERLDRNWNALLQEMRVIQTGIQLLTGFLLTLPFQSRFAGLGDRDIAIYLVTVVSSVTATLLVITPVALHRLLFRRHAIGHVVSFANRLAIAGVLLLGVSVVGTVTLIFDVVVGPTAGTTVGVVLALVALTLWIAFPLTVRRQIRDRVHREQTADDARA